MSSSKEDLSKPEAIAVPDIAREQGSVGEAKAGDDEFEVFKQNIEGEHYRSTHWYGTFFLMFKALFSTGVLSIPAMFGLVGAVPGVILVVFWGAFNTYAALVQVAFRNRHPGMHGVQDFAYLIGGKWYRELVGGLFLIGYVLVVGSGIIAGSSALNALSDHGACTVWFAFVCFVICTIATTPPRFSQISWGAAFGCISLWIAILILVIAVGVSDRPALAPEGEFELGFVAVNSPGFLGGLTACLVIFVSSSGTSAFIPMIAEMKNPKEYKKPIFACMGLLNFSYIVFAMIVYRYCGIYIAPVALGSAGTLIKKITFGIGLPGILFSTIVTQHIAAKYLFVRLLRDTEHLQKKTARHWITWISCCFATGAVGFIMAEAIPFFGTLLGLLAAIAYTPLAIIFPMTYWLFDFWHWRKENLSRKLAWFFHVFMFTYGCFQCVAGSYAQIQSIIDQYAAGLVDKPFSCADNS